MTTLSMRDGWCGLSQHFFEHKKTPDQGALFVMNTQREGACSRETRWIMRFISSANIRIVVTRAF